MFQRLNIFILIVCFSQILSYSIHAENISPEVEEIKEDTLTNNPPTKPPLDFNQYEQWLDSRYSLLIHKGTYLIPFSYNWKPDESLYSPITNPTGEKSSPFYEKTEAEIQISFMIPVYRKIFGKEWDLFFAYTHHSWWQLYNSAWSKPFRETNYMPELFLRRLMIEPIHVFGLDFLAYDFGYIHASNGQMQVLSRSWDRLFARMYFRYTQQLFFIVSGWVRSPEAREKDDNSDILSYMGMGELEMYYRINKHSLSLKVPFSSHPGVTFKYSHPWTENLRAFIEFRTGYGHSLIEYNREVHRVGIGIALENFMEKGQ